MPLDLPPAVLLDRAGGALLGLACGDALGVPYELAPRPAVDQPLSMSGGGLGNYQPGEWSDETQLAVCLAEVTAAGGDLRQDSGLNAFASRLFAWYRTRKGRDLGLFMSPLLAWACGDGRDTPDPTLPASQRLAMSAAHLGPMRRHSPGGEVLALAPVLALAYLGDEGAAADAAAEVGTLLTADTDSVSGLVYFTALIRRAVLADPSEPWFSRLDFSGALEALPVENRTVWQGLASDALARYFQPPRDNSALPAALSAALGAVGAARWETQSDPLLNPFKVALEAAVRNGGDTDTVAALTGALMGAACGQAQIPAAWLREVHGWPGLDSEGLADLGRATALIAFTEGGPAQALRALETLEALAQVQQLTAD
ncbi:hypothetical protein BSR28_02210 [Boudabousia liubingyangii]|uniref:ADP-ribosylglycohydrolase family protein n=1 Tax=Boudabousia liubingyangii TaxID=1921764 RepID=UPI0009665DC8|nr:ADP-ribosylglycohydrolase family protein [Boudabousia liubingyangii]OKL48524.1 hypothetical protein BSR28_02210 [Boudabousia liubingyangii]